MAASPSAPTMAYSGYIRTLNLLIYNKERLAIKELEKVAAVWKIAGIEINIEKSILMMKKKIGRMIGMNLLNSDLPWSKSSYMKKSYIKESLSEPILNNFSLDFKFNKEKQLRGHGTVSLSNFTDEEIYEGAVKLLDSKIISYNNIAAGGYASDLKICLTGSLSKIYKRDTRLNLVRKLLEEYNIEYNLNEYDVNLIDLVEIIALHFAHTERTFEIIIRRLVQILLNETDVSEDYILDTDIPIYARNYVNFGFGGGLLNSLFCNIPEYGGAITLDLLIKSGVSDCRGTNALYAALLNIGYKKLGSTTEARILYVKMAHGTHSKHFESNRPENHNIVLVKSHDMEIKVLDAYFEHIDGVLLRDAINGSIGKGRLKSDETCIEDEEKTWAFQISGIPRYPPQQCVINSK